MDFKNGSVAWKKGAIALCIALALSACDNKKEEPSSSAPTPTPVQSTPQQAEKPNGENAQDDAKAKAEEAAKQAEAEKQNAEQAVAEKMQAYIQCYNSIDSSIHDSINRYSSWVKDFEKGPTGKESTVYGLYAIHQNSTDSCQRGVTKALDIKPAFNPMDEIAASYLAAAEKVSTEINALNRYYDQGDYTDDKFAKGKELHPKLLAAYKAFEPASKAFSQAISEINDERQKAHLKAMEESEGKTLSYYSLAIMMDAKSINRMIEEDTFDAEKSLAMVSELQNKIESSRPLIEERKKANDTSYISYDSLLRQADSYAKAAKERIRRVRDKEPYSRGEQMNLGTSGEWMVNGSVGKLIKEYNSLVGDYNRL
ncbi:Uncharacterised protein [Leminorella richardii]|uniref:DUF3829 domain-containing protein n=2 Tax=Leminorella richardii TaxID=158841 RepID=A0A2X4XW56_9GAMM|nr:Uncharacterised protein [Leminorella richardii]